MDEAEEPRDQPSPSEIGADDVLERHVDDRGCDRRLDEGREPRARRRQPIGRAEQGEGVGDREGGDDRHDLPQADERNHQAEQEEQVVDPAQDVRDAEHHEPRRGPVPGRVEPDPSRAAGDHHRPAFLAGRQVPDHELEVVLELGGDRGLDREAGAGRVDGVGEMGVEVALIDVDGRARSGRLGDVRDGVLVAIERTIRGQGEPAGRGIGGGAQTGARPPLAPAA